MPEIGEIKRGYEIGTKWGGKYIWVACKECGKERWVNKSDYEKGNRKICPKCNMHLKSGRENPNWKGGRYKSSSGYIQIRVYPDDFFYPMCNANGYIKEHRLKMAKHLNRCLLTWEVVHHKNGIKDDNRIENLELLPSNKFHLIDMVAKGKLVEMGNQIKMLKKENKVLRDKIKQLEGCIKSIKELRIK